MLIQQFEKPVRIWVGLGFPSQLNSVMDAYQMLADWNGDGPEQMAATRACRAALLGEIDAETARSVVIEWARRKDVLVEESNLPPSLRPERPSHV